MGKIISLINSTPDGFVDSQYVNAEGEFHEFVHTLMDKVQTVGFGRHSFELFQQTWPAILVKDGAAEQQVRMARALTDKPKNVYSSTLTATSWRNSTIVGKIDPTQIPDLLTIGSPGLVAELTRLGLVDEYYFSIQPLIAGGGSTRLFDKLKLEGRQPLTLIDTHRLKTGVLIVHYRR